MFSIEPAADFLQQHPHLASEAQQLANAYADRQQVVTDQALQAIGTSLYNALNLGDSLNTAKQHAGQQSLTIVIRSDQPAILQLPWETLYHPDYGFLGRESGFTLSRRIANLDTDLPATETGPLRILLFTSLPDTLDENSRLSVEAEQAAVQEALAVMEQQGLVELEMPDEGGFDCFKTCLQSFNPHLVYLSGHGNFHSATANTKAHGIFLFEDDIGGELSITEQQLAQCFDNTRVQAVVLSACQSSKHNSLDLSNGLSQCLAHKGIPYVIGMRESILDVAGIQFARAFFTELGRKQSLAFALQKARAAIAQPLTGGIYRDQHDPVKTVLSYGQWCLPMLISQNVQHSVIDWQFQALPRLSTDVFNQTLGTISLPQQFLGRRRELRVLQSELHTGKRKQLLLTGAGGMGKTALAGKLLKTLQKHDYVVYAYSARPENNWNGFILNLKRRLGSDYLKDYDQLVSDCPNTESRANLLLSLLMEKLAQQGKKLALFFDNLESVQNLDSHALTDDTLQSWLRAAQTLTAQGLVLLVTSRWRLPDWQEGDCYPLAKPVYGDFIAFVRQQRLPPAFIEQPERLRHIYKSLGGNFRAVEFFAHAVQKLTSHEEQDFLAQLEQAQVESQTDMALDSLISHLSPEANKLLPCLLAYHTAIPFEGIKCLMLPDTNSRKALQALIAVSLVEQYHNHDYQTIDYQLSELVRDFLHRQGQVVESDLLVKAAHFQFWLFENERYTLEQAMATHKALHAAGLTELAHRLVLDKIVGRLTLAGLYRSLLEEWLPPVFNSVEAKTQAEALGQMGKQCLHLGEYNTALDYLQKSLAIQEKIGDLEGEGTTLNNISQIYKARGDLDTALSYLQKSLAIREKIGDLGGEGATLNNISYIYKARGDLDTALGYLQKSLAICEKIGDLAGEGTTLNNISAIYHAHGDLDTALSYLQKSLVIREKIGDRAGLCPTLFNIGNIHYQNKQVDAALQSWLAAYRIAKAINLAQALAALEGLANQLGLPDGLQFFERLAQQYPES